MFRLTTQAQQSQLNDLNKTCNDQLALAVTELQVLENQLDQAIRNISFDEALTIEKSIASKNAEIKDLQRKIEWSVNFENYLQLHKQKEVK